MPILPHLHLRRVDYEGPRRRRPGFGQVPKKNFRQHGNVLETQVNNTLQLTPVTPAINPELILRVKVTNPINEETLGRFNLTLIGQNDDHTLVLFSSDQQLTEFRNRLNAYQRGPRERGKNAPYYGVFNNIEELGRIRPEDRIGRLFREQGITTVEGFLNNTTYTLDLELWHTGNSQDCRMRIDQIRALVEGQNGRVTDSYIGTSIVLARIRAGGETVRGLLSIESVAVIDSPPRVSLRISQTLDVPLTDLAAVPEPPAGSQGVCTLDSGITGGHPLLGPAVGEATAIPAHMGDAADSNGHGTMVAGLALYGDVQRSIDARQFVPQLRLYSARVLNANNEFDDDSLITTQMRGAIEYFRNAYGCRVFNASLGDSRTPFNGGKLSPWSAILDHLARELDVVIVVSAGNYDHEPPDANDPDHHLNGYPQYLLDPPAKIIEPATGCIVLTVGALAGNANVPPTGGAGVDLRPIAQLNQPSPFTRSGPGIDGAIKPELVAEGGNLAYSGVFRRPREIAESSVVSTSRDYLQRLFNTGNGTSYAAPRVAHKAARLLSGFPQASANLIRALLVSSAEIPRAAVDLLEPISASAPRQLCGYGLPSLERASSSDANRVLLYNEGNLPFECFHIYEVPIPQHIYEGRGTRRIGVTLAFDPPVRHSRLDYLGATMSFRLIRGKSVDEVARAFRQRGGADDMERIEAPYDCPMLPKPTEREGGTVQRGTFTMRRSPTSYGDTYYLVVRCHRAWASDQQSPQRYAVVVTIDHEAQVDLYAQIQARLRTPVRVQIRTRR